MKILVATKETQGQRANDYSFVPEREIVGFGHTHDGELVDAPCGCQRAFTGTATDAATTTVKVIDSESTPEEFIDDIVAANAEFIFSTDAEEAFRQEALELLQTADHFPVGAILERRGWLFRERTTAGLNRAPQSDYKRSQCDDAIELAGAVA